LKRQYPRKSLVASAASIFPTSRKWSPSARLRCSEHSSVAAEPTMIGAPSLLPLLCLRPASASLSAPLLPVLEARAPMGPAYSSPRRQRLKAPEAEAILRVKLSFEQETPKSGGSAESAKYETTGIAATVPPELAARTAGTPG